jgi:type VI secretion system protein ImpG
MPELWAMEIRCMSRVISVAASVSCARGSIEAMASWCLAGILHVSEELLEEISGGAVDRGVLIEVTLDSQAFCGEGDVMLFGELLHRFFELYAEINLFTKLEIVSLPTQARIAWPRSKRWRAPL